MTIYFWGEQKKSRPKQYKKMLMQFLLNIYVEFYELGSAIEIKTVSLEILEIIFDSIGLLVININYIFS